MRASPRISVLGDSGVEWRKDNLTVQYPLTGSCHHGLVEGRAAALPPLRPGNGLGGSPPHSLLRDDTSISLRQEASDEAPGGAMNKTDVQVVKQGAFRECTPLHDY